MYPARGAQIFDMLLGMTRVGSAYLLFLVVNTIAAQSLPDLLSFEGQQAQGTLQGWNSWPAETVFADNQTVHGGHWSARIERQAHSPETFSNINHSVPVSFSGQQIEFRGFIRTENVSAFAGLWLREDGDSGVVAFDNMQSRHVNGTTDWTEYSITLPLEKNAKTLIFGALLVGTGRAWVDDLVLLVDGKPLAEAPKITLVPTVLDKDHEFNGGSHTTLAQITPAQIDNLTLLGKVWGFLKYHHPAIGAGERHWDYDLLRILPTMLAAPDHASGIGVLTKWIDGLGNVSPCVSCAKLDEADIQTRPDVHWIANETILGKALSGQLQTIYRNRSGKQFYVSLSKGVGNPSFDHELAYPSLKLPDAGFQILALFRYWNDIEYWYPDREIIGEEWDSVLREFVAKIALAQDATQYQLALMALIAKVHDSHANLWSSITVRPPAGKCDVPVKVRAVEDSFVISSPGGGLERGDVITKVDGAAVRNLTADWKPYYGESNEAALSRDFAAGLTRGPCGPLEIAVRRGSQDIVVKAERLPTQYKPITHDLPGPGFRLLSPDVAYLKLSAVKTADAAEYVKQAAHTKGLIIDIRNYPSEFMVWSLGSLLVAKESPFVRFTFGDLSNPGSFHWGDPLALPAKEPHYQGKVVILVDEVSLSQAEYTTMAFRVAQGAIVVGSTTAGADGNVSSIALPGGLSTGISGIGVFYPDKRPTQRIGIVADVPAKPTLAGIRAGRDEVLEVGLRQIVSAPQVAVITETLSREIEKQGGSLK
jgi:hypothetical protein